MAAPELSVVEQPDRIACLEALERRVLWLASWTIHHANHVRESRDGLKVGGHQASCASVATLMTALYFGALRPEDRVAVKPHASPVFHAIMYMLGRQDRDALERFRALGGAQSYPSRTKDAGPVDFSTGSVGLGVATTLFASLVQDYVHLHRMVPEGRSRGRMVAIMGDAELDEGNVFEALLEGWKHDVRNLWWIIDYNRQSLDGVVSDRLFQKITEFFGTVGWKIVLLKYGKKLQAAFARPGGEALHDWIENCPNGLYSALVFKGQSGEAGAWRTRLLRDLRGVNGIPELLDGHDDEALHALMTNLAGHDMAAVAEAYEAAAADPAADDVPHCFIAYTIKGHGTPLAGHKDNHAGLMTPEQMAAFRRSQGIADGAEWEPFADSGMPAEALRAFVARTPFAAGGARQTEAPAVAVPARLALPGGQKKLSTQAAFGAVLAELAKGDTELAKHIVTTSPDVTVSTNLGPWVNQRGIFSHRAREDVFREEKVVSAQKWAMHRLGQHVELGIAENNLFLLLCALGISGETFGARLLPVGTVYDPFIGRGLDALYYACYSGARFMLAGTPSGVTLAPEGGAHQSISTPLIGMGQPGLLSFEPTWGDELAAIMAWGFDHMQRPDGDSVYLRLTTRALEQPARAMDDALAGQVVAGGYWLRDPDPKAEVAIAWSGAVATEALSAADQLADDIAGVGLLNVTSPDRLYRDWQRAQRARAKGERAAPSHVETLLGRLGPKTALVTVHDGHPAALSWLGGAAGRRVYPLGVTAFGQSADIPDIYAAQGIDADAILDAVALACVEGRRGR
ncbi:MAG: hypothetical protein WD270_00210 [Acetobacterales bacterium]